MVPEDLLEASVLLRVSRLPVPLTLTLIADQAGATWSVDGGKVVFAPRE